MSLQTVLVAATTSLSVAEVPLGVAARCKAGAVTPPPTVAMTASLTSVPAVLLQTSLPTASVARMARSAPALASEIVALAQDGAVVMKTSVVLAVRMALATAL